MQMFSKLIISLLFLVGISTNLFAGSNVGTAEWLEVNVNGWLIEVEGDGRELGVKLRVPFKNLLVTQDVRIENDSANCNLYDSLIESGDNGDLFTVFYISTAVVADTGGCDLLVIEYSYDRPELLFSTIKYWYNTDY